MFARRLETPGSLLAEPMCTLSNLWFVLLGLTRLWMIGEWHTGYVLLVAAGFCSAYHHATYPRWTIVIDWVPISLSLAYVWYGGVLWAATLATWLKIISALAFLVEDHVTKLLPVPWAHTIWHILASWAVDDLYWDKLQE